MDGNSGDKESRIITEKIDWPVGLFETIEKHRNLPKKDWEQKEDIYKLEPIHTNDFDNNPPPDNHEYEQMIKYFAPKVRLIGPSLWSEKINLRWLSPKYWGGTLVRVLQKKERTEERCLQYLYLFTKQQGTVSLFWMSVIPFLMWLWSQFILSLNIPMMHWLRIAISFIPTLPLLLMSLSVHLEDLKRNPKGGKFVLRATTPVIFFYLMLGFSAIAEILSYGLLVAAVLLFLVRILEDRDILPTSHEMDYVPVFIWIKETNEDDNNHHLVGKFNDKKWIIEYVVWDFFHYYTKPVHRDELTDYIKEGSICLEIPDMWHAMEPERVHGVRGFYKRYLYHIGFFGLILSGLIQLLLSFNPVEIYTNYIIYVLLPLIFIWSGICILRGRSELTDYKDKKFVMNNMLLDLWNMNEEPRLKVMTKLQDPWAFTFTPGKQSKKIKPWLEKKESFHDDLAYIYGKFDLKRKNSKQTQT